jgi:16S rRNA (guanine527-N7)-methyltransferase
MMGRYSKFCELLLEYNRVHKITGAKTKEDIIDHIDDSLYPMRYFKGVKRVLDIGTGAGFPGLVLAIEYPDIEFHLVEPLQKRVAFLYLIKSVYRLSNVVIHSSRVEDLISFDVDLITSRAVTKTTTLIGFANSFIKKGVKLLLYKGEKVFDEVDTSLDYDIIEDIRRNYLIVRM